MFAKCSLVKLFLGNSNLNKDMLFPSLRFWLLWNSCPQNVLRERCWDLGGGPGLGFKPSWNLGLAPVFQPDFPAKYVSYRKALWTLEGPSLSCQSQFPCHERTSLFSLRPHASFYVLLAPSIILGSFYRRLWNRIYALSSLPLPLQELTSINQAFSVFLFLFIF